MNRLQTLKIALLIVILAEEIKRARKTKVIIGQYSDGPTLRYKINL
ncbi:hypothetical protein [Macrococcoides canis]|nr:hypothetical protein [Macrococcus canis]UTH10936.1 hypothetical protein KFV10_08440 [Macrococcus canis]